MRSLALVALVLAAVPWAFKLAGAEAIGESCEGGFDCALIDGRCVQGEEGRFCTIVCESDGDCPSGGYCGLPPHDAFEQAAAGTSRAETVCVPGSADQVSSSKSQ